MLLDAGREGRIELFTSVALLSELTNILGRSKFDKKIVASAFTVDELVDRYAALATVVRPIAISRVAPDPNDDIVIGTALAAKVNFIVTGDKQLRSVVEHQGVRIVGVIEAMGLVETS